MDNPETMNKVSPERSRLIYPGPRNYAQEMPGGSSMTKQAPDHDAIHLKSNNRLPLHRSVNSVTILADYARKYGIESDVLLAGSGIQSHDLHDPEMLITPRQEMAVFRRIIELIPDPKLGLHVGRNYNISANGKVAIPAMFCDTFLDYIRMMFRYIEVTLAYFRYELTVRDNLAILKKEELIDLGDLRRFVTDRELMSVYMMSSGALGSPLLLNEIRLIYPKPDYASYFQEIFFCPVTFNADENMISFDKRFLFRPLPMANALARNAYEKECKRVYLRLKEQGTTLDKIKQELMFQEEGIPSLEQLARRLNISPRTLRRHLTAEGTSYKALVNDMR
ncbi:AraC family transcriptional regulator, partial [bacterium]|nr:AraC family transcriptional regulator [bacterium]